MGGGFRHVVPSVDSTANETTRDVVGNKGDSHFSDSLSGHAHNTNDHFHMVSLTYPALADGPTVTADNVGWTLGALVEIVGAGIITSPFDIHEICVEALSAVDRYLIVLYYGAGDIKCAERKVIKAAQMEGTINVPCRTIIIPSGSRIRAALACKAAVARTADISINYHLY